VTSPVAGFVTGAVALLLPAKDLLPIQCEIMCGMTPVWTSERAADRYIVSSISVC
jgi:hypothetical protein